MALKVWLPLTGTLENKGISNVEVIGNGVTINNNGKLGQCCNFNNSNIVLKNINLSNISSLSVACWIKDSNTSSTQAIINCRTAVGNGLAVFLIGGKIRLDIGNTNCTFDWVYNLSNWTHICCTAEGNVRKLYVNGTLQQEKTVVATYTTFGTIASIGMSSVNTASPSGNILYADLNDFRLYTHCLSAKEVKEISQGLILHYKLDGFSGGAGENLLWNSKKLDIASAISNKNCSNRGSSVRQLRTDGFNEVRCSAAWQGLSTWVNQFNLKSGDKLTYSFYVYTNGSNKSLSFYPMMYDSSGTRDTSSKLDISLDGGAYTSANSKSWGAINNTAPIRHYVTFIWNDTMASILNNGGKIELSIQIHGTFNSGEYGYIFAPKLEYGDKPTAWSPAPEEIGIDTTRIVDSSGYGNDGIAVGSLQASQDSERYGISTAFAASSAINCGRNAMVTDSITVNLWAKYSTFSNLMSCTESGGWNFENSSGLTFPVYVNSVGYVHIDAASRPPVANYANVWHMFTGVYDRLNQLVKLYIDGELIGTGAVSAPNPIRYHATNCIWINAEATGSNTTASYGNAKSISDVRIYATALSAEDILDLYHTPANIDNLGGIHGFEMVEDTSSRELLALPWTSAYSTHNKTSISTNYNDKHEWYSNTNSSAGSDYIKINPTGKTYYWDTEVSIAAGNQFYIGFERYDANKTSRSNNACVYVIATKPTSDIVHQRYSGVVNLATDGVNPTDTITLRILNAWSGTDSGSTKEATIHYLSLREATEKPKTGKVKQQGQIYTDEFVERQKQASVYENGFVGGNIIIEK